MKMTTDLDLLRDYAQRGSEKAFTALVARHLDLVYSAALRQVKSSQLAEDIAQSVFTDLGQNVHRLKPDTVLAAWLYQVTRRTALNVARGEGRRQAREQIAVELADMNATSSDWTQIEPWLNEAMETLDEPDRAAILLRYFQNKSLREVGKTLGTSEDTAQKRVSRAVERLREFFAKRGVTIGASGLVVVLSANAVQVAPVGLAVTISTAAALAGTAIATAATKAIAMTTLQKSIIGAPLAAAVGTGIYEARQTAQLQNQIQTLQQQKAPLIDQIRELQQARDDATNKLAALQQENETLKSKLAELPKLRGEVARLRGNTPPPSRDPIEADMKSWLVRVSKLKQRLAETPGAKIPEMRLLDEEVYMGATSGLLNTESDYLAALSNLRSSGEFKFITTFLNPALTQFAQANNGQFPTDLAQLQPYFPSPVEDAILDRWEIAPAKTVRTDNFGDPIITTKAAVDADFDPRYAVGLKGFASAGQDTAGRNGWGVVSPDVILGMAAKAYVAENNGQEPTESQLLPYLTTPAQRAALEKLKIWRQEK